MGYPQPNSNAPALLAQNSFRILTPLYGGDMYESEQGAQAFAIGPSSDVDRVLISYYDSTNPPTMMSQVEITPQAPFYGGVPARLDAGAVYQPSGRQGRILMAPSTIYNNIWVPNGFSAGNDQFTQIPPILDLIQYFTSPPSIPVRATKQYNFQNLVIPSGHTRWVGVPFFGRSFASISFDNPSSSTTFGVYGFNFTINNGTPENQQENLYMPAAGSHQMVVQSNTNGFFDYLLFTFASGAASPTFSLRIQTSDIPQ